MTLNDATDPVSSRGVWRWLSSRRRYANGTRTLATILDFYPPLNENKILVEAPIMAQ
jgi:hypothetical protein